MAHRARAVIGKIRIDSLDLTLHFSEYRIGIASVDYFEDEARRLRILLKGKVESRQNSVTQEIRVILGVFGDADHGKRLTLLRRIINLELAADGILTAKELLHHGFVDHGDPGRSRRVLGTYASPEEDRNPYDAKIVGRDGVLARA